jgi:hypothetical protein
LLAKNPIDRYLINWVSERMTVLMPERRGALPARANDDYPSRLRMRLRLSTQI